MIGLECDMFSVAVGAQGFGRLWAEAVPVLMVLGCAVFSVTGECGGFRASVGEGDLA